MDHLGIANTNARKAIITGDPDRVPIIAKRLGSERKLTDRRGFVCYSCDGYEDRILVASTGIGGPSTAIVVEELFLSGIRCIVRIGTCGSLQKNIPPGTLVIPTGCVRDEGTSRQYAPLSYPAVPSWGLTHALLDELRSSFKRLEMGIVHCKDAYYLEKPWHQLSEDKVAQHWCEMRKAGVLATEMESSTLFVLGQLRRLSTAAVLIAVGNTHDSAKFGECLDASIDAVARVFKRTTILSDDAYSTDDNARFLSFLDDFEF